jgi:hypothetical protein
MVDLLKAISESVPYLMGYASDSADSGLPESLENSTAPISALYAPLVPPPDPCAVRVSSEVAGGEVEDAHEALLSSTPTRIRLLTSQELLVEPEMSTELECQYCHQTFRLQDGGALFEGKAACMFCEQKLNRDVVLPTVSSIRSRPARVTEAVESRQEWERVDDDEEDESSEVSMPPAVAAETEMACGT